MDYQNLLTIISVFSVSICLSLVSASWVVSTLFSLRTSASIIFNCSWRKQTKFNINKGFSCLLFIAAIFSHFPFLEVKHIFLKLKIVNFVSSCFFERVCVSFAHSWSSSTSSLSLEVGKLSLTIYFNWKFLIKTPFSVPPPPMKSPDRHWS